MQVKRKRIQDCIVSSVTLSLVLSLSFFSIFSNPEVFAAETIVVNMPTGSADPNAPYFWQNEKDGSTTGEIHISVGDTITWENADSAAHTVTSGTPETGPDDIFDSSLFAPGKSFSYTFEEIGEFPFFCLVHPWMTGTVYVESGFDFVPEVGSDAGDGTTTFDVEYQFNRVVSEASVNEAQKAITFTLIGAANSDDHTLTLLLPKALIDDPYVVWADGQQISEFELESDGELNTLVLPLTEATGQVTIIGSSVVPEFHTIAALVLALSIVPIILLRNNGLLSFSRGF